MRPCLQHWLEAKKREQQEGSGFQRSAEFGEAWRRFLFRKYGEDENAGGQQQGSL
jgi:hypothetical protein